MTSMVSLNMDGPRFFSQGLRFAGRYSVNSKQAALLQSSVGQPIAVLTMTPNKPEIMVDVARLHDIKPHRAQVTGMPRTLDAANDFVDELVLSVYDDDAKGFSKKKLRVPVGRFNAPIAQKKDAPTAAFSFHLLEDINHVKTTLTGEPLVAGLDEAGRGTVRNQDRRADQPVFQVFLPPKQAADFIHRALHGTILSLRGLSALSGLFTAAKEAQERTADVEAKPVKGLLDLSGSLGLLHSGVYLKEWSPHLPPTPGQVLPDMPGAADYRQRIKERWNEVVLEQVVNQL